MSDTEQTIFLTSVNLRDSNAIHQKNGERSASWRDAVSSKRRHWTSVSGEAGRNRRSHERVAFVTRIAATQVNEYRAFTVGHDGHVTAFRAFVYDDGASQLIGGYDIFVIFLGVRLLIRKIVDGDVSAFARRRLR